MLSKKIKSCVVIRGILINIFILNVAFFILGCGKVTHREIAGVSVLNATADKLENSIVTPHLEEPISRGKNVLWCATAQIAWNELCDLIGEDVHLENEPNMVAILNKKSVTRNDLDEASYVAMAGFTGDNNGILAKIREALQEKFGNAASPDLLPPPGSLPPDRWVAYSYLFKNLPFKWAFERMKHPLHFGDARVECFGINQYLQHQKNEAKAASQILIYNYQDEDNFIVELKTRSEDDRLILAKVPPEATLARTIETVQRRVDKNNPTKIKECNDLSIPVLNFDVTREYFELYGKLMYSKNQRFDGSQIGIAIQQIRFKLDETGAVLKSEALFVEGLGQNLIFNKPFLIIIQRKQAKMPYFALWVDNAELLVPFEG